MNKTPQEDIDATSVAAPRTGSDLAEMVDDSVLEVMTASVPGLIHCLRELAAHGYTNKQIIGRACAKGATPTLMRNMAHCLDAIRRNQNTDYPEGVSG